MTHHGMPTNALPNHHRASYALFSLQSRYVYARTHSTQVDHVDSPPALTPHHHFVHSQSLLPCPCLIFYDHVVENFSSIHDVPNGFLVPRPIRTPHHGKPRLKKSKCSLDILPHSFLCLCEVISASQK